MLKIFKIILIVLAVITFLNIIFLIIASTTNYDLTIKIKPYAFVFAHGSYVCSNDSTGKYVHATKIDGKYRLTEGLLSDLRKEGYEKIWISMCYQGDSNLTAYFPEGNGTIKYAEWGDDVSRIKTPGKVYPIYLGFFFYRINYKGEDILSNCGG